MSVIYSCRDRQVRGIVFRLFATFCLLLISTGTAFAQSIVADLNPGTLPSLPNGYTELGGRIYFSADDGINGVELWSTDLSSGGTQLVKDINPGLLGSNPDGITAWNGRLYFRADNGANGIEMWVSDGSPSGTHMLTDIYPGINSAKPKGLTPYNGALYFRATSATAGRELWRTDGTATGTEMVADINPGVLSGSPTGLTVFNGQIFFRARHLLYGMELWKSDGTSAGTILVRDIAPDTSSSKPYSLTVYNGQLFFGANDPLHGIELWATDGTPAGTRMLIDLDPGVPGGKPDRFLVAPFGLLFRARTIAQGKELWITNGTPAGTRILKDMDGITGGSPKGMNNYNGKVYFRATTLASGRELWETDGTSGGTRLAADINPGPGGSSPSGITEYRNRMYFRADDGVHGSEFWQSDGTAATTSLVKDIRLPAAEDLLITGSVPRDLLVFDNKLLFTADDGAHGTELFSFRTNLKPTASFTVDQTAGIAPVTVRFDASSSTDPDRDPLTFSWAFGDGLQGSGETVSHSYSTAGVYSATLTVDDGSISNSSTMTITVEKQNMPPVASMSVSSTAGVAPLDVQFDAGSSSDPDGDPLQFLWTFGDGGISTEAGPSHVYSVPGVYSVELTVSDGLLTDATVRTVNVSAPNRQPAARIISSVVTGAAPLSVDLDASQSSDPDGDILSYEWDLGDGVQASSIGLTHTYVVPGTYVIALTVSDGPLSGTDTITLVVTAPEDPIARFTMSGAVGEAPFLVQFDAAGSTDPNGIPLVFTWNFGDGSTDSGERVSHTFVTAGVYTVTLTAGNGITETAISSTVQVFLPNRAPVVVLSASAQTGDAPLILSFDGSGSSDPDGDPLSFTWLFGDGSSATGPRASKTYATPGSYLLKIIVSDGVFASTDSLTIEVLQANRPPIASFGLSVNSGPAPLSVTLDASASLDPDGDPLSYFWDFGDGSDGSGSVVSHVFTATGVYIVRLRVEDARGLSADASSTIQISTSVASETDGSLPTVTTLHSNYPNPFQNETHIVYDTVTADRVILRVFDSRGKMVVSVLNEYQSAGEHDVQISLSGQPPGVYFYMLIIGRERLTGSMILLR